MKKILKTRAVLAVLIIAIVFAGCPNDNEYKGQSPAITTSELPNGTVGTAYSQTLVATGTPPITFSITSGVLPSGLTLNAANGAITGTLTGMGEFAFTVRATNAAGNTERQFTIIVTHEDDGKGDGSPGDPFIIGSLESLVKIGTGDDDFSLDASYELAADITLPATPPGGSNWTPIGNWPMDLFNGTFNGNGRTITGLTINRPDTEDQSLFSAVGAGGIVKDLKLEGVSITGLSYVAGVAWYNAGTVTDVSVAGVVQGSEDHVGGVVGQNDSTGTVENSYSTAAVSGGNNVGGVAGLNSGTVENSYATGSVKGADGVGGVAGLNTGTVKNSYATGSVSGQIRVGGLVGNNITGTVQNSYATGSVTGQETVGGLVGVNQSGGTVRDSHATGSVTGQETVGGLVGVQSGGTVRDSHATGSVTGQETVGGLVGLNSGTVENSYATGSVTGAVGVGGVAGLNTGTVRDSHATGSVSGEQWVGGLVGVNQSGGTVRDSRVTGDVIGTSNVGGLVGLNYSTVLNSYATGSVTGQDTVGGLVGSNVSYGMVQNSYATGNVTGQDEVGGFMGATFGGLVGFNSNTVQNSYATGSVTGNNMTGGLVGQNLDGLVRDSVALSATITRSGVIGTNFGRVIGDSSGTLTNNHGLATMTYHDAPGAVGNTTFPDHNALDNRKDGADFTNSGMAAWTAVGWDIKDTKAAASENSPWWWDSTVNRPRLWFE